MSSRPANRRAEKTVATEPPERTPGRGSDFPVRALTLGVFATLVLLGVVAWTTANVYAAFDEVSERGLPLQRLIGDITYLDEELTASVRMAAATGDPFWAVRYRKSEPRLEAAISEAIRLTNETGAGALVAAEAASRDLVALEKQALDLVRAGELQKASDIVFSRRYEEIKEVYAEKIATLTDSLRQRIETDLERSRRRLVVARGVASASLVALLAAWIAVGRVVSRHLAGRTRAERALRESEERYRTLAENASDLITEIDESGRLTYVSPNSIDIIGREPSDLLGRVAEELGHPEDLAGARGTIAASDVTDRPQTVSGRVLHGDGTWRWLESTGRAFRTDDGRRRAVWISRDVTRQRQLQQTMQQAQKLESLSILSGGIAHDFNNLLTAILSQAGTARRKLAADDPVQVHLADLVDAATLASQLTARLLAYAGRGSFDVRPLDLRAEIRGIEPLLAVSVRGRGRISLDLEDDVPAIDADPVQLHQVLLNLAINAAESAEREVNVRIRVSREALDAATLRGLVPGSKLGEGPAVLLEVADDGGGMDEPTLRRIFDPFFTTKATGRGLGLAALLGIVHGHGAGVGVSSSPGTGTVFRIFFPFGGRPAGAAREASPEDLGGHGTVLVVDDDEFVLQGVYFVLESYGYAAILAQNGRSALEYFRERSGEIDLVILDMTMPGMSGEEVLRELRGIRPDVRVLLSTGFDADDVAGRFAADGIAGLLRKPYQPEDLAAEVKRLLGDDEAVEIRGFDAALDTVRAGFRRRLPNRIGALRDALAASRTSEDSPATLREAWRVAHTLKGTAGSYGFPEVSAAAATIADALRPAVDGKASVDWPAVEAALDEAEKASGA